MEGRTIAHITLQQCCSAAALLLVIGRDCSCQRTLLQQVYMHFVRHRMLTKKRTLQQMLCRRRYWQSTVDISHRLFCIGLGSLQCFFDNHFASSSGGKIPIVDPRTAEFIFAVEEGTSGDVDKAVHAASEAFIKGEWPRTAAADVGKPVMAARFMDVPGFTSYLRYYAGWADKLSGQTLKHALPVLAYTLREPVGVCALITPWNFPLGLLGMKLGAALACGNTVVVKPAEQAMLTTLKLAQVSVEAGFPPRVFNVVTGYGPTAGAALVKHPLVNKVAFTGSSAVGKQILVDAAATMKPVSLECGGKCPLIICADADLEQAVETAYQGAFLNAGQFCTAATRLFLHEDIYDDFITRAVQRAQSRTVGDPFEPTTEQGPIAFKEQFDKILSLIKAGTEAGATLLTGGKQIGSRGYYIEPTLFADVKDDMRIAQEEIFGPVQCCMKWKTMDEVIHRANNTSYGLAAGVFTKDLDTANQMSRRLKAGTVWINNCWFMLSPAVPFGGYKDSGLGSEGGQSGTEAFTKTKAVMMPIKNPAWL